jgi:hypothetical protein
MAVSLLSTDQDLLLASTMTHQAPQHNYAGDLLSSVNQYLGPSWLERLQADHDANTTAFQKGGAEAMLKRDHSSTIDLIGGFAGMGGPGSGQKPIFMVDDILRKLLGEGRTIRNVAQELGVSKSYVDKRMGQLGIKGAKPGPRPKVKPEITIKKDDDPITTGENDPLLQKLRLTPVDYDPFEK